MTKGWRIIIPLALYLLIVVGVIFTGQIGAGFNSHPDPKKAAAFAKLVFDLIKMAG